MLWAFKSADAKQQPQRMKHEANVNMPKSSLLLCESLVFYLHLVLQPHIEVRPVFASEIGDSTELKPQNASQRVTLQ